MSEIVLTKRLDGSLIPVDPQGIAYAAKLKVGAGVTATFKKHNNLAFHKKMMALFNLAFEAWTPVGITYKGQVIAKNFEQFRKDMTILAGYYETVINLRGDVRVIAKSLNFSSMKQDDREQCYSAVIDVVLAKILTNYTKPDLENVLNQVMAFA